MRNKVILFILAFLPGVWCYAQDGPSTWFEFELSKKILPKLKVEFNPEARFLGGFKKDSYILEGGLSYKLHKYLTVAGYYRYENVNDYKKSTGEYKGQKSLNRLAFDAKSGFGFNRFDLQFRLRYTNSADFDQTTDDRASFFRYRAKIEYDIKGNKLVPYASVEVFHDLIQRSIDKYRYTGGLSYPISKKSELSLFYRLQDYTETGKKSVDIIGIGYSLKL